MNDQDIDKKVAAAIKDVIRGEVGPFGLVNVTVTAAEDHAGDPSLMIDVEYREGGQAIDTKVVAGLVSKLRERLWTMGERRFPYIRHHFSEKQKVVGYP